MLSPRSVSRRVYDKDATPAVDGAAGYDSTSEVHVCPLAYEDQLANVVDAEHPIYLYQVHEDFKRAKRGYHPLLNAPMWLGLAPTTVVSLAVRRDSGQALHHSATDHG